MMFQPPSILMFMCHFACHLVSMFQPVWLRKYLFKHLQIFQRMSLFIPSITFKLPLPSRLHSLSLPHRFSEPFVIATTLSVPRASFPHVIFVFPAPSNQIKLPPLQSSPALPPPTMPIVDILQLFRTARSHALRIASVLDDV